MAKKKRHISLNVKQYLRYFTNSLSNEEKHAFEKKVMQDLFDEEAYEGLSSISPDKLKNDLKDLNIILDSKLNRKNKRLLPLQFIRYAALIALLIGVGSIMFYIFQTMDKTGQIAESVPKVEDSVGIVKEKSQTTEIGELKKMKEKVEEREIKKQKAKIIEEKPDMFDVDSNLEYFEMNVADEEESMEDLQFNDIDSDFYAFEESQESEIVSTISHLKDEEPAMVKSSLSSSSGIKMARSKYKKGSSAPGISYANIKGQVIDEINNEPIPGVNVIVKGTTIGAVTDIDGNYIIEVPKTENPALIFNFLGYVTKEVEVVENDEINVELQEDLIAIDEVVVVGYGSIKKSDVTGSVVSIKGDETENEYSFYPPEPVEGMDNFKKYIKENIRYNEMPEFDKDVIVKLKFTVESNGVITNIIVVKSQGEIFDNEAIRLLKEGPDWKPALENNKPVAKKVSLKIKFEVK